MKKILIILLIFSLFIGLLTRLAELHWFFELFTHYVVYYALLGAVLALLSVFKQMWKTALLFTTLAAINLATFAPYLSAAVPSGEPNFTLLSQNFFFRNEAFDEFYDLLDQENPDLFVIHEAGPQWWNVLGNFADEYPYLTITQETGVHGIVMGSRVPGTYEEIPLGTKFGLLFTPDDQTFQILAVHPFAPITGAYAAERNAQFADIVSFVKESTVPTIVVGDFNSTPWSPYFQQLLEESGLSDSRLSFGIVPTWHAHNFLFQLPIDFALVSADILVSDFYSAQKNSADHLPIVLKFKMAY